MHTIVIGSLCTDLIAAGLGRFPDPGEHVYGKQFIAGPGGKARNIADMVARLSPDGGVAMIGRTAKDPYGLWKLPIDALHEVGVATDYVTIVDDAQKMPAIAFIAVDRQGKNQIFVLPGISEDLSTTDIDNAGELFKEVGKNQGVLIVTLERPVATALYAIRAAHRYGVKVVLDPGGIEPDSDINDLFGSGIYLIKPNEYETEVLTGVRVIDFETAKQAAAKLHKHGTQNVLITAGAEGAYLFTKDVQEHIPVPAVTGAGNDKDATGCGDQAMAALCASIRQGKSLSDAAKLAVLAGTLQFHKAGVSPLSLDEFTSYSC